MSPKRYQNKSLSPLEEALVHAVMLGASGDSASVAHFGRQILRRDADTASDPAVFREALGTALLTSVQAPTRSSTQLRAPVDTESNLPLARVEPGIPTVPPLLVAEEHDELERLLGEHRAASTLESAGLSPTRSVLISGAPGVGKTMTARYISASLELPLVTVDLAGLMSSFLGRTGQNLRQALDYGRSFRCVLLLDEFDALAKRRDDSSDVGELKRIVNVLLLELERWPVGNLLVAATNHPELLDRAIGRRFDWEIELSLPDLVTRLSIIRRTFDELGQPISDTVANAAAVATDGFSGSDIDRLIHSGARRAVIENQPVQVQFAHDVMKPLLTASRTSVGRRAAFSGVAIDQLGMSQRAVGELLGLSHPTVGKLLRRWRADLKGAKGASPRSRTRQKAAL